MSAIISQILFALTLSFGHATQPQAQDVYSNGGYHVEAGVVIIDTDALRH